MRRLQKISVLPLAKMMSVLNTMIGFVLGIIAAIGSMAGQEEDGFWALGVWSILVFPVVNAVLGFCTGLFLAGLYNLFSQWFGGIEFELEEQ